MKSYFDRTDEGQHSCLFLNSFACLLNPPNMKTTVAFQHPISSGDADHVIAVTHKINIVSSVLVSIPVE